nr:hypothetical protein [Acidobacteriota bacterium]
MPIVTPESGGRDLRAELLPPELLPLFDDRFVRSCDLIDEYVRALAGEVARDADLAGGADPGRFAAGMERVVDWLTRVAAQGPAPRQATE